VLDTWVVGLHHEYVQHLFNGVKVSESMPCGSALGTDILKSLACVKSYDLIWLRGVKTLDDDFNGIVT